MKTNSVSLLSNLVGGAVVGAALLCASEAHAALVGWLVQGDTLYGIDRPHTPGSPPYVRVPHSNGWTGATSIEKDHAFFYIIQNTRFYRVPLATGSQRVRIASGRSWDGATNMAYDPDAGALYVVNSGRLYRFQNPWNSDTYTVGDQVWFSTSSMAYKNRSVYIIRGSSLRRYDTLSGQISTIGPSVWSGATRMVVHSWATTSNWLYIVHDDDLWQVDPGTGNRTIFGTANAWPQTTTLFCHNSGNSEAALFAVQDNHNRLLRINNVGAWSETDGLGIYDGPIVSTGALCDGLI